MADKKKRTLGDDLRDFRAGKIGDKFHTNKPVPFMVKTDDVKDTIPISSTNNNNTSQGEVYTVPSQEQYYQRLAGVQNITTVPSREQQFQYKSDVDTLNQLQQHQNKKKYDETYSGYNYAQLKAELAKTDRDTDKELYSYLENKANERITSADIIKELERLDKELGTLTPFVEKDDIRRREIEDEWETLEALKKKKEFEEKKQNNYTNVIENDVTILTALQKYYALQKADETEKMLKATGHDISSVKVQSTIDSYNFAKALSRGEKEKIINDFEKLDNKDELYRYFVRDQEEKEVSEQNEILKDYAEEHPVKGSLASISLNTYGSVSDAVKYIGAGVDSAFGGEGYINPNATNVAKAQVIREKVSEDMNGAGKFLYSTGMSIVDNIARLPITALPGGKALKLAIAGTSAGVSYANEVIERGGSLEDALFTGGVAAVTEIVFEKIPLDKLAKLKNEGTDSVKKAILTQIGTEAFEELGTEGVNIVADYIINPDLSQFSLQYQEYIKQGYSETEASKRVAGDIVLQLGQSMLAGGISGGVLSGGALLLNYGGYKLTQKDIENLNNKETRKRLGEDALADEDFDLNNLIAQGKISRNKKAVKLANSIERTIANSGKDKITAGDVGNLMYLMTLDRPNNNYEVENTEKQEIINENYTLGGAPKNEVVNTTKQTAVNKNSKKTTDAFGNAHPHGLVVKTRTGGSLTIMGIESSAKDFGASDNNVILITSNGGKVNADDVYSSQSHFQQLFNYAKNFDTLGARNFVKEYETYENNAETLGRKSSVEAYAKAFEDLYSLGKMGVTYDSVKASGAYESAISTLGGGIAYNATLAGNLDTNVTRQSEHNKVQKIRVPGERNSINSKMYVEKGSENSVVASDEQLQLLQAVAQKVGRDIVLTNQLSEDKNGKYENGKIYIRADLNENYMLAVALHEATHVLRANSPLEYQALCEFIMNYLVAKGENVNSLLDNIKDNWKDNVSTEDEVLEELVCQTVMAIATNEQAINTVLNIKENKNILQKVASALKKIAQYTYDFMKGIGFDRHNLQAQAWLEDAKAIQTLAEKLSSALDKNRNVTTTKSTEQQKNNTATNDDVKYSLNENAKTELHKALYDMNYRDEIRLRDETPPIMLAQKGVKNLPMTMKISHIRENVFTAKEAKQFGLRVDKYTHYHGLGENFYLQIIDELDNITEAYRGTKNADNPARSEKYFLLISKLKDKNGNVVNVPIYINEKSQCNRVFIDANKISTVFGRDNFQKYIKNQIAKGNLVRIKNRSSSSSERNALIAEGYRKTASNKRIPQDNSFVNNQSMRDTENNSSKSKSSVDDTIYTDTEYMKAVENDDMETAHRLVDGVAKANGYTIKAYHGTTNQQEKSVWNDKTKSYDTEYKKFTVFKKQYDEQVGHFFNDDVDNAGGYGSILYSVYLKMNKPLVIDCNGQNYASIVFDGKEMDTYEWADYAKRNGYDGIIFKNISDGVGYDDLSRETTDYVVFNSNQIKSADPVTYDNKGDIIPLSKRFINYSVDIRYSVDDTIIDFNDDLFLDEDLFFEGTEEHINFEKVIKDSPADALNIIYNTASKTALTGIAQFKDVQLDYKAYTSIAHKVMQDYRIYKRYNPDAEAKIANTIRRYVQLIESGNYSDGSDLIEKLVAECKSYIMLSGDFDKTVLQEEREAILGYLSGKTLLITDYAEDFVRENYGNVAKYRRNMMGKVSVGLQRNAKSMQNTMYMDDVISFVEENYPMFITDECDSVQGYQWLDNLLNNVLQPKFVNRYFDGFVDGFYENADTAAIEMAFDMTTEVISAKAKQLVISQKADKKKVRELTKARKIAIAEREAMLKAKAENYKKQFQDEKAKRIKQINDLRDKLKNQKQRSGKAYLRAKAKIEHLENQLDAKTIILNMGHKQIRSEYNERRDKTMYIEHLGKMFDRLSKRLDGKANNNEYIPEKLKKPILDVLRSFYVDPGTYKNGKKKNIPGYFGEWKNIVKIGDRVKELTSEYEKLRPKKQYNPLGSNNADSSTKDFTQFDLNSLGFEEDTLKILQNLSGFVEGKNIYDLTSDDLKDIYGAMLELEQTLKRAVEIIIDGQKTTIKEAAVKAVSEIKLVKDKSGSDSLLGLVQMGFNQFATSSLDPVRFARRISGYHEDSVFYKAMNEIHSGEKKSQWIEMQSTLPLMNVMSKYSNKEIKNFQTSDVSDFDFKDRDTGKRVKISQGMLLSIYLTNRQEDGHRHLVNEDYNHYTLIPDLDLLNKNSIIADATKAKTRALRTKAHRIRLSKADLIKINEYVESNRMLSEIAGAISQVYNVYLAGEINEVSMKKHGRKIATVKNYFPLKVDPDRPNSDPYDEPMNVFMDMRMRSRGFTKNRHYSTAPLVIDDVLRVFSKSVKEVSRYCGLLIPIENFDKIYNSGDGYTTVRKIIGDKFGVPATHYINKIRGDLQNNQDGDFYNFLTKLQGNYMASVLLLNGGATLKNLSAFPTANKYFGTKNVAKASAVGGKQIKEMYDTYAQYTPYLWYRQQGNSTVVGEMSREHSFYKMWTDRIDIMGKVDTLVVGKLLYAAELHVEKTTNLQRGTEEFYREVVRQWEKCIDETQPNNMVTSKPQYLRNKVIKILSFDAFRSQVQAIGNTIIDSVGEYSARSFEYKVDKNTETKKAKNQALKKVAQTFIGAIESYALNSLFQLLVDSLRHKLDDYKDEEGKVAFDKIASKYLDYFTENFAGVFMWGEQTYEVINTAINHERFFGLEVMSLETINDGIEKAIKGDFLGFVSLFFDCFTGLPTGTATRDIRSIYSYIVDWTKGYGEVVTNNKGQIEPSYFNYMIVRAKQNGETEKAEHFEDMWIDYLMDKKGKTKEQATETIKDKLVTALAVSDDDVELSAQAFANGDLDTYETHLNKVIGYGFDSKDVKRAVDKAISNIIVKLKDEKITEREDVFEDLKEQGFTDKGCEYIYNEMQNSTEEKSEEVASVFADTSEDKGVAYTYSDAFEALKSGDKDNYNHIKNYLIEEVGKEEKDIKSAMRSTSRTDPLWKEYVQAYEDSDGTKMREIKNMLTNIYGSWDSAVEAMHRYQKRMKEKENK